MNKKILGVIVFALTVAMLATPVLAEPTKGQKAAITIEWAITSGGPTLPPKETGNVTHTTIALTWDVTLLIDGVPTYSGTATTERKQLIAPAARAGDREFRLLNDYYVLTFDGYSGTFEGNALLQTDWSPEGNAYRYSRLCHALLQGTGVFEGQTINAKHDWRANNLPIVWPGYLLKPQP
jgi:hypothetical protein